MMLFGGSPEVNDTKEEIENKEEIETATSEERKVIDILKEIDINNFTPMEALLKINELKKILN